LLESFPFLGFFFSRFCLSLLMKEVCHDFLVSRSATQPQVARECFGIRRQWITRHCVVASFFGG
jgi:hypothetical protein